MAKNISYNRNTTEKFNVKGILSDDCTTITYLEGKGDDEHQVEIFIEDCLKPFAGWDIDFTLTKKDNEDLDILTSEEV